jgi:predicted DNA-binding transcriptional regulator YafY
MIRTLHSARRSLRAALAAGRHMVSAAISAHHRLLVRLAEACDTRAVVRIRYVDRHGTVSVRDISPHTLRATNTGHITVRAFDHRDGEDTTFRTDRITIA